MKKSILFLGLACGLIFTSCVNSTQEVTIRPDGTGTMVNTGDMGTLLTMLKQMGGGSELEKAGEKTLDTSFSLAPFADSLGDITPEQKELVKKGTLAINMDIKNDKFVTKLNLPFNNPSQIAGLNQLATQLMQQTATKQMGDKANIPGMSDGQSPKLSSIDDYYVITYKDGVIEKKLNKEKYAGVDSDETMEGMKEISGSMSTSNTYIVNLPRPAKKAEGKSVSLSADKKTVTVAGSSADFFDDPSKLEFRIEY